MSIRQFAMDVPEGWSDKSMLIYSLPEPAKSGVAPNIVVTEDSLAGCDGTDDAARLSSFAAKRFDEMKANLPDPAFHEHRLLTFNGKPAAQILVSWQNGRIRLTQLVVFIASGGEKVIVATSTAADSDFLEHRPVFEKALSSLKIVN